MRLEEHCPIPFKGSVVSEVRDVIPSFLLSILSLNSRNSALKNEEHSLSLHSKNVKLYIQQNLQIMAENLKRSFKNDLSLDEYLTLLARYKKVNQHLRNILLRGKPYIRIHSSNLLSILLFGFQTIFDNQKSSWFQDLLKRNETERRIFWYTQNVIDPSYRPRYGYRYDSNPFFCASNYWDVICQIKFSWKDLITLAWWDTFSWELGVSHLDDDNLLLIFLDRYSHGTYCDDDLPYLCPYSSSDFKKKLELFEKVQNIDDLLFICRSPYVEFQCHADLTSDHIEAIFIPKSLTLKPDVLSLCLDKNILLVRE